MKLITVLILLLTLATPAGMLVRAGGSEASGPQPDICRTVEELDSGSACCDIAAAPCCCRAEAPPVQPPPGPPALPAGPASGTGKDQSSAPLPALPVLREVALLDLSSAPVPDRIHRRGAALLYRDPVRLCVLRCRLTI